MMGGLCYVVVACVVCGCAHGFSRPRMSLMPLLRPPQRQSGLQYKIEYFTQRLDHFSFRAGADDVTFQQRYLINKEHWRGSHGLAPFFVYCGNEGDIEWFAQNTGFLWEIAPLFGAFVVFPEHRYYGKSIPYNGQENLLRDAAGLAYLTAEQALADFAILITELKRNFSAEASPVVLFGGSYGGMLAAWMRLKYPHIAIGALASSAPILQFEDLVPADTYNRIVSADFKRESTNCFNTIKDSWTVIRETGQKSKGLRYLSSKFRMCRDFESIKELEDWLYAAYSYLAMVNYPYAADFIMPLPAYPIKEVCQAISSSEGDVLTKIFTGINIFYNYTGEAKCFDVNEDIDGMDLWDWQECTEMVMPMSSNVSNSMFPPSVFDFQAFEQECLERYHVKPRPSWISAEFGGHGINEVLKHFGSNIVFSNGLLDPWSGGGILHDISTSIVALLTKEGAHHLDLRSSTKDDPPWLVEQRQIEISYIDHWLQGYYTDRGSLSSDYTIA